MKNEIVIPKEFKRIKKMSSLVLINFFIIILLITGCGGLKNNGGSKTEIPTLTFTITPQPTNTPSLQAALVSETLAPPVYPSLLDAIPIDITQMSVQISTVKPVSEEYLYQDAQVTLKLDSWNGVVFLNLDDITDNNAQNSDFLIYINTGSMGTTFEIYPTNYARNYYSDNATMDYASCVNDFPKTSAQEAAQYEKYPPIDVMIDSGNAYCILTNEGRMAVVNMVIPSNFNYSDDQGNLNMLLVVTVYNRIVTELFVPAPTATTGPSPTPTNRYSERNISDPDQIKKLDDAIQAFIDAISIGDKAAIANMVNYPIYVRLTDTLEVIQINTPSDFVIYFDKIIPEIRVLEIAKTTIESNVHSYPGAILLEYKDGAIAFSDNGLIEDIY